MIYLIYTIHVIVCLFLIMVVLLQQGKGADLSVFGGGSTQTAFGAVGATSFLHKLTVSSFVLFILTTMTIAILQGGPERSSVMSTVLEEEAEDLASGEGEGLENVETPADPIAAEEEQIEEAMGIDDDANVDRAPEAEPLDPETP